MTLDNRVDMSDGFYLQEKVRRLESDVEHHAESHRKANEMLMEERQKVSTLQSNVKMVESEKYRAYKRLNPYAEFNHDVSVVLTKLNKPIRTLLVRVSDNIKMDKEKHSKYITPIKKLRDLINELNDAHTKFGAKIKVVDNEQKSG